MTSQYEGVSQTKRSVFLKCLRRQSLKYNPFFQELVTSNVDLRLHSARILPPPFVIFSFLSDPNIYVGPNCPMVMPLHFYIFPSKTKTPLRRPGYEIMVVRYELKST